MIEANLDHMPNGVIGRFAPSPSGYLHAGNIFAYLISWLLVKLQDGQIVLRIEDLDSSRSKSEYANRLIFDLEDMGLTWDGEILYQSNRNEAYEDAFEKLDRDGLIYPCFCTRADLHAASAPHSGEKSIYSRKCASLNQDTIEELYRNGRKASLRLRVPDKTLSLQDELQGEFSMNLKNDCGDFIIRRSDGIFAYQLAVVVDDAFQGVNLIVRGCDLLDSTPQQIFLQDVLNIAHVHYAHIPLITDESGRRLSKRNSDAGSVALLEQFGSWERVIGHIAFISGIIPDDIAVTPEEIRKHIDLDHLLKCLRNRKNIVWS